MSNTSPSVDTPHPEGTLGLIPRCAVQQYARIAEAACRSCSCDSAIGWFSRFRPRRARSDGGAATARNAAAYVSSVQDQGEVARANNRLRSNPRNVTAQAARAMNTNTRGIWCRAGMPVASARRKVQTVYMPRGNTAPQYSGL